MGGWLERVARGGNNAAGTARGGSHAAETARGGSNAAETAWGGSNAAKTPPNVTPHRKASLWYPRPKRSPIRTPLHLARPAGAAAGRTRLLVTNQLQYTPYADRVVVIGDGHIVAQARWLGRAACQWRRAAGWGKCLPALLAHNVRPWHPAASTAPSHSSPHLQGTYDKCLSNEMFARLLREHNADHGAESTEVAAELPPGEPLGPAPSGPALMRADTTAITQRAAAKLVTSTGRTAGDSGVQQARLAAAPTFVRRDPSSLAAKVEAAAEAEARQGGKEGEQEGSPPVGAKAAQGGKYGRQLARFETMIQQNRGEGKPIAKSGSKVS